MGPGETWPFSVKSAYTLAFEEATHDNVVSSSSIPDSYRPCWKFIWSCEALTLKNFTWHLATNSLPTWKNKQKCGLEASDVYPVCGCGTKDIFHPFCFYPSARELWVTMSDVWTLSMIKEVQHTGKEWLLHALEPLAELERSMLLMNLWRCWFISNEIIHEKIPLPLEVSKRFLRSYLESLITIKQEPFADPCKEKTVLHMDVSARSHEIPDAMALPHWNPPPGGWLKLNSDGSFVSDGSAGFGMVLRHHASSII